MIGNTYNPVVAKRASGVVLEMGLNTRAATDVLAWLQLTVARSSETNGAQIFFLHINLLHNRIFRVCHELFKLGYNLILGLSHWDLSHYL
jgi:hypothetical protein